MIYVFYGHIYPTNITISMENSIISTTSFEDQSIEITMSIHGQNATAICTCKNKIQDILTFRNILLDITDNILNSLCLLYGTMFNIEFLSYTIPEEKNIHPLAPIYNVAEQNLFTEKFKNDFMRIVHCTSGSVGFYVHDCLRNLKLAMTQPIDTGFFVYRCLENIRNAFMHQLGIQDSDEKAGWGAMKEALGGDAKDINWIRTEYSLPRRHGRSLYISGNDRDKCISIGYKLIYAWIGHLEDQNNKKVEATTPPNSAAPSPELG